MTQLDPVYILKLIEASKMLSKPQKEKLKAKLPELDGHKIAELQIHLQKEQKALTKYYKTAANIKKRATESKVKALYGYAERKIEERETAEINSIETELANI